jgi:hypothetical protein
VLVRLRPYWEELKIYLLAKGRKRFEAFICTMSERDYALEMWRLLDPDARLINPRELNERVTCVKSGMAILTFARFLCQKFSLDFSLKFCTVPTLFSRFLYLDTGVPRLFSWLGLKYCNKCWLVSNNDTLSVDRDSSIPCFRCKKGVERLFSSLLLSSKDGNGDR